MPRVSRLRETDMMPNQQRIYEELAEKYQSSGEARQRDVFLFLAADAAHSAGQAGEAERLRGRLLALSPHHLLRPYASFAEALRSNDIKEYLGDLRRQYPADHAQQLLKNRGTIAFAGDKPAHSTPPVFNLQEPLPANKSMATSKRKSPYEVPAFMAPPANTDHRGNWLALVLFLLLLAGALVLAWWTMIKPLWQ
jgi:hypothetical protein